MTNLTWQQIAARWDAQADSYNSWDDLGFDEQIEFSFQQGVIEERERICTMLEASMPHSENFIWEVVDKIRNRKTK